MYHVLVTIDHAHKDVIHRSLQATSSLHYRIWLSNSIIGPLPISDAVGDTLNYSFVCDEYPLIMIKNNKE